MKVDYFLLVNIFTYVLLWANLFALLTENKRWVAISLATLSLSWTVFYFLMSDSGLTNFNFVAKIALVIILLTYPIQIFYCLFKDFLYPENFYLKVKNFNLLLIIIISVLEVIFIKSYYNSWHGLWFFSSMFLVFLVILWALAQYKN